MNRRAQALHGIALLLAACLAQAEPFGYAVNSDSLSDTDFDQLYRVDLATGDATLIGPVGYSDVEGLAISPDGVLYGVDDGTETLLVIDTETGQGTPVNDTASNLTTGSSGLELGASYDFGLTFDQAGRLWLSSDVTGELWQLDPETGEPSATGDGAAAAAVITASGDGGKSHSGSGLHRTGLAGCGDGGYGVTVDDPRSLVRIRTSETIDSLDTSFAFDDGGLDFDGSGGLWGIADRSTVGGEIVDEASIIFTVDPETGAATQVATTIVGVESLAIAAPGPCPESQHAGSHEIPAMSRPGTALLALLLALGAGAFLRRTARH